ncbi:MARVEL domain-containing protein [Madurella fahalii]|uniref:MARVEL domain-containing protein n=1 Tax=Madurella fahalii TaxID=1157608 RepID=A0ABQ0GCB3_9PEZI
MDTRRGFMEGLIPRTLLGLSNFIILASSTILTGILAYFIRRYRYRGTHVVYGVVIAVLTLFFYLFAMFLPALKSYRGYMLPLNMALSYLWLTSLIFSSQDYSGGRCRYNSPPMVNRCGLKHTVQAFSIIGFIFLLFNTILEALMWASHRRKRLLSGNDAEKDRPLTTTGTAGATNGERATQAAV